MGWLSDAWNATTKAVGSAYNSTVGKAVDTAKNLWTAGTTPTTGNIVDAFNQSANIYKGLSSPTTKAATQKQVAKLKNPATSQSELAKIPTTQKSLEAKAKYLWEAGTTPVSGNWIGSAFSNAFSPEVMKGYSAIAPVMTEKQALPAVTQQKMQEMQSKQDVEKAKSLKIYMDEYKKQMDWAKTHGGVGLETVVRAGHQFITGLTGAEPGDISTGNKIADTISSIVGQGAGFVVGGLLTGGEATGARVAMMLPELKGAGMLTKIASSIARGAVKGGVEAEMLSGIHSVLNADTPEQARERAKEYGLMGFVGGGAGGAGAELLGMIAKKLKVVTPDSAVAEHIKDYTPSEKTIVKPAANETIAKARAIMDNFDIATPESVYKASNVFQNIIHNADSFPKSLVRSAKESMLDLHDLTEHRYKWEMAKDLTPTEAELAAARPELHPAQVEAGKTVEVTGLKGEKMKVKIEPIEGKPDEFWMQKTGKFGRPEGEKVWGKTDYWTIREAPTKAPKLKAEAAKSAEAKAEAAAAPTAAEAGAGQPTTPPATTEAKTASQPPTEAKPPKKLKTPGGSQLEEFNRLMEQTKAEATGQPAPTEAAPTQTAAAGTPPPPTTTVTPPAAGGAGTPPPKIPDIVPATPGKLKGIGGLKAAWEKFYTKVVDDLHPIMKLAGKDAESKLGILATNAKSVVGGISENIINKGLVDKAGNVLDDSLQKLMEKVPKGKENEFWQYISQKVNAVDGKLFKDITPEMSQQLMTQLETSNPEFKALGDTLNQWVEKFANAWGKKPQEVLKGIFERDNAGNFKNPVASLMDVVSKTVKREKYNDVMKELVKNIQKNPDKIKDAVEIVQEKPLNMESVKTVTMDDGSKVYVNIKDPELLTAFDNILRISDNFKAVRAMNSAFKTILTTKNPVFGLKNFFRDVPTAYAFGSEANPIKFGVDLLKSLGESAKETLHEVGIGKGSERVQLYRRVGGGGGGYFKDAEAAMSADKLMRLNSQSIGGKIVAKVTAPLKFVGKGFEHFNDMIETAPRLAEFNRVLDKTGDIDKAIFAANDVTVNFSRGGRTTKAFDAFVPYLNAGVQGLDKMARQLTNPSTMFSTIMKAGVSITVPSLAFWYWNHSNPNYQKLSQQIKDTNYLIPVGGYDKNGNATQFIKIPKTRELGILFGSLFERIVGKEGFKGYAQNVLDNVAPANPIFANLAAPILQAWANKNFFGSKIVPTSMELTGTPAYLQTDEKTSKIMTAIAAEMHKLGIDKALKGIGLEKAASPKIMDYVVNQYTGLLGDMILGAFTGKAPDKMGVIRSQFLTDSLQSNQTISDFYDNLDKASSDKAEAAAGTDTAKQDQTKIISNAMAAASKALTAINKKILAAKTPEEARTLREEAIALSEAYNKYITSGGQGGIPPIPADTGVKASTGKLKKPSTGTKKKSSGGGTKKKSTGTTKKSTSGTTKSTSGTTKSSSGGTTTTTKKKKLKTVPSTTYPTVTSGGGGTTTYPKVTGGGGAAPTTGGGGSVLDQFIGK